MKTKLEMAHEIAVAMQSKEPITDMKLLSALAWQYADAMRTEADEREKEEAAQRRKEIREMLNAPNTFVEREGQHFDDFCSDEIQAQRDAELYGTGFLKVTYDSDGVKYKRLDPKTTSVCSSNIGLDSQVLKEWQPDWSQAPNGYDWWAMDENKNTRWIYSELKQPYTSDTYLKWFSVGRFGSEDAPSFGYTGDWRNSLRKRPE